MESRTQSCERIALVSKVERIPYAQRASSELQRESYEGAQELAREYGNAPAFRQYWKYNEETGEGNGSSPIWLVLENKVLARKGLRTLTTTEGRQVDKQKRFSNGIYRDFELIVYSEENPNSDIAQILVPEAQRRGWTLPIIAHPLALDLRKSQNQYGVEFLFGDNDSLIVTGEEAQRIIDSLDYKESSGVHRSFRGRDGSWGGGRDDLADSYEGGRGGDWVRGEATRSDFERDALIAVDRATQEEAQRYIAELEQRKTDALKIIKGKK